MSKIKVFDYIPELDCFVVSPPFKKLMEDLDLAEWTPVVWLGRLFAMDQDFGEHIFDNWDERTVILKKAKELGINLGIAFDGENELQVENELMVVVPDRFTDHGEFCFHCKERVREATCPKCQGKINVGPDGPCHSDEVKKRFWTDVLDSLTLDLETIFLQAKKEKEGEEK